MDNTVQNQAMGGYGYASDEVKQSTFNFGLNAGKTFLKKFEWIPNGGANGAEQEALEVVFNINGTEKGYRLFPVTKAYDKNNNEVTDPNSQEMKDAFTDFNAKVTHILHCFQDINTIKASFARPIKNFKEFCQIAMSILPKDYANIPLDIFMVYQYNIKEGQERAYLEIPKTMKYGRWLAASQVGVEWKTNRVENPDNEVSEALSYYDVEGSKHPFVRNGWFMNSKFAIQSKSENTDTSTHSSMETATPNGATPQPVSW